MDVETGQRVEISSATILDGMDDWIVFHTQPAPLSLVIGVSNGLWEDVDLIC